MTRRRLAALIAGVLVFPMLSEIAGLTDANASTSAKSITTCTNIKTGVNRVLIKGSCISKTEKKVSWTKTSKTGVKGAITTCTNIKTGANRLLTKGVCNTKTEKKAIWVKVVATPSKSPVAITCANGGTCMLGSVGPGGGVVFYVADSPQPWGRYIEAAAITWQGGTADPAVPWCNVTDSLIATKFEIGTGAANTAAMISQCSSGAAVLARAYKGGGKSDWFLPSIQEIHALHGYIYGYGLTGYAPDYYWSSTQDGSGGAWEESFGNGGSATTNKYRVSFVRPVRVF